MARLAWNLSLLLAVALSIGCESSAPSGTAGLDLLFPEEVAQLEANEFRGDFIAIIADEAPRGRSEARCCFWWAILDSNQEPMD